MFKLKHQSTFIKYPFLNSPVPNQNRRETEGCWRERKRERLTFLLRIHKREQMFLRYSFFPLESLPLIAIPSWFYFFCYFWLVFFYLYLTFHPSDHPGHVIIVKLPSIVICLFFCASWRFQFPSWIQWSCRMMMSQDCLRPQFFVSWKFPPMN